LELYDQTRAMAKPLEVSPVDGKIRPMMRRFAVATLLISIAGFFFEGCSSGIQPDPSSTSNAAAVPGERRSDGPDVQPGQIGSAGARIGW
jgi:hypothetical protein